MIKELKIPDIGEGIDSVEITEVHFSIGQEIHKDDIIITVETEKASMEITSEFTGVIKDVLVHKGEQISPNSIIANILINNNNVDKDNDPISNPDNKKVEVNLPDIGEGINDVEITSIDVNLNELVKKGQTALTVETEKASMEIPIESDGKIVEIHIEKASKISPGDKLFTIELFEDNNNKTTYKESSLQKTDTNLNPKINKSTENSNIPINNNQKNISKNIYTSPSVRRFARKLGCDLNLVEGSGPKGRILKEDVEKYISNQLNRSNNKVSDIFPEIDFNKFGLTENLKLNKIKKITGSRLQAAWHTIPQVTQFDKADITELDIYRSNINKTSKMSFIPFYIKALIPILKDFPNFNSSLNKSQDTLILKKYFNIGIAVDTPNGLIVPIIKDADKKNIYTIMDELIDISNRARNKQIKPNELQGGCITISSLGGIGGTYFTPIVNPPEVAILGISKASIEPYYLKNQFEPRKMLPISLTYDHRVIDGALAAKFTSSFCKYLSNYKSIPGINKND